MEKKLNHIDAMRGVAILMVILVHTSQKVHLESGIVHLLCDYGQMGVQLFFVASAFTLCKSWAARSGEDNKIRKYFIRRFFRIAPLYYFGIFLYGALSVLENYYKTGIPALANQYSPTNILVNIFLLNGFYYPANNNIVPGGWSIGTEVAFYAIFPLLFFVVDKNVTPPRIRKNGAVLALCSLGLSLLTVYLVGMLSGHEVRNNSFIYFSLINQFPVFVIGVVFFKIHSYGVSFVKSKAASFLWFAFFSIMSMSLFSSGINFLFALIPVISGISFLFLFDFLKNDRIINNAAIRRIGRVSYSMYLFHFIFAHEASGAIAPYLERYVPAAVALVILYGGVVAATFLVSNISEWCIERPFIKLGNSIVSALTRSQATNEKLC